MSSATEKLSERIYKHLFRLARDPDVPETREDCAASIAAVLSDSTRSGVLSENFPRCPDRRQQGIPGRQKVPLR